MPEHHGNVSALVGVTGVEGFDQGQDDVRVHLRQRVHGNDAPVLVRGIGESAHEAGNGVFAVFGGQGADGCPALG